MKETAPKVGCFAYFCDHRLTTTSAYMHVYCYPVFESGMNTDLCEQLPYVEKI